MADQRSACGCRAEVTASKTTWKASVVAVVAASAVDAHSSWNKQEVNPLLAMPGGRFGARGVSIKALVTGAALAGQWAMVRHNPSARRYATIINFTMAAVYAKTAAHNYGNSR